jgi:hypothetical protein
MRTPRGAIAALLVLAGPALSAEPERARHPTCTGIYTGSARGVFWCRVVAVHDGKTDRSTLRLETEDDVQLTGDALTVSPGGMEWKGPMAPGELRAGAAPVLSAWSTLETGQPPNQADYAAGRGAPQHAVDQGDLKLELVSAEAGPKPDGSFTVHGTFSARLVPIPGAKAVGEIRVTVTF